MGDYEVKGKTQGEVKQPVKTGKSTLNKQSTANRAVVHNRKQKEPWKVPGHGLTENKWKDLHKSARNVIEDVYLKLGSHADAVGIAYINAWDRQKMIIDDANKRIKLERDMVLGLFGAVAGAVLGDIMSGVLKNAFKDSVYLLNGAKTIVDFVTQKSISIGGTKIINNTKAIVGTKPSIFAKNLNKRLKEEHLLVNKAQESMTYKRYANINPKEYFSSNLHEHDVMKLTIDESKLAKKLELKLWKLWVKEKGAEVIGSFDGPAAQENLPKEVFDYLKKKFKIDKKEVLSWNPYLKGAEARRISIEEAAEILRKEHHWTMEKARRKAKNEKVLH